MKYLAQGCNSTIRADSNAEPASRKRLQVERSNHFAGEDVVERCRQRHGEPYKDVVIHADTDVVSLAGKEVVSLAGKEVVSIAGKDGVEYCRQRRDRVLQSKMWWTLTDKNMMKHLRQRRVRVVIRRDEPYKDVVSFTGKTVEPYRQRRGEPYR